jgi:hypothetical protein
MYHGLKMKTHAVQIMFNNISAKYHGPKYLDHVTLQSQI